MHPRIICITATFANNCYHGYLLIIWIFTGISFHASKPGGICVISVHGWSFRVQSPGGVWGCVYVWFVMVGDPWWRLGLCFVYDLWWLETPGGGWGCVYVWFVVETKTHVWVCLFGIIAALGVTIDSWAKILSGLCLYSLYAFSTILLYSI